MSEPLRRYRVGGAVRDALLGLPVSDNDWVVVGATPEQMLAAGYRAVGKDFPVFLHPETHEEHALARTERKTGPGYKGFDVHFSPGVTLEEDLERRDLTVNAIAQREDGSYVDPFNGRGDIDARVLRHVSEAFAEDPVRILRIARFAARFPDFRVDPGTMALMARMVDAGEVDALVAERVWQEVSRGLMTDRPSRTFEVLHECGAMRVLFPELNPIADERMRAVDLSARAGRPVEVRFTALIAPCSEEAIRALSDRLRVPARCKEIALCWARVRDGVHEGVKKLEHQFMDEHEHQDVHEDVRALLDVIEGTDGLRRADRLEAVLDSAEAIVGAAHDGRLPFDFFRRRIELARTAAAAVDQASIARQHAGAPQALKDAIRAARLQAIDGALATNDAPKP